MAWKRLRRVKANLTSIFSGAISRFLLSHQRFFRHRLPLILSSGIPISSAVHTTSASSVRPMMLVPAGPGIGDRHTWCSTRMLPPATPERHHMSFTYQLLFLLLWRCLPLPEFILKPLKTKLVKYDTLKFRNQWIIYFWSF